LKEAWQFFWNLRKAAKSAIFPPGYQAFLSLLHFFLYLSIFEIFRNPFNLTY